MMRSRVARTQNTFRNKCYELVKKIPRGKVSTYAEIARALSSRAYRAVGNAMSRSPGMPAVPCHRVVRSDGKIGGFSLGEKKKIKMLENEGVEVKNGRVDLGKYLFRFS